MNSTAISNISKAQKVKFRHDSSKLIYFQTFIYNEQIYYIAQCDNKKVYVGRADQGVFDLSTQLVIKEKIKCIGLMWKTSILYVGTNKGTIVGFDIKKEVVKNLEKGEEDQEIRISATDGKQIIGILALQEYNEEIQQKIVIAFNVDGVIRKFIDGKLKKTIKLPAPIHKFTNNRSPTSLLDIWCIFFLKQIQIPYMFDIKSIQKLFKDDNQPQKQLQTYKKIISYEDDQFSKGIEPTFLALSNSLRVLIIAYGHIISIYEIKKKDKQHFYAELEYQFTTLNNQRVIGMDLLDASLAYQTESQINSYNVEQRTKISKSMTIKGSTTYNTILWAKIDQMFLYGSADCAEKTKMMFHRFDRMNQKTK